MYRETDEVVEVEEVIQDMLTGQFNKPVRVVAFNTTEGWARDVSEDIAWEVLKRVASNLVIGAAPLFPAFKPSQ